MLFLVIKLTDESLDIQKRLSMEWPHKIKDELYQDCSRQSFQSLGLQKNDWRCPSCLRKNVRRNRAGEICAIRASFGADLLFLSVCPVNWKGSSYSSL